MRAFVAVNLPDDVRAAIADAVAPVRARRGVRWVEPEALHITLQFLGNVADDRIESICASLERAAVLVAPFRMRLNGFGAFPSARRPRVLWVGVADAADLVAVQSRTADGLAAVGFTPEARPFHPHVTVGRAERGARAADVAAAAAALAERTFEAVVDIASVELMESRLARSGARYSVVRRFPF